MVSLAKQYADHAMEYRWNEKATPDGIDYYAALGAVRDSDNDTLVSSYARVSLELQEPLELFERLDSLPLIDNNWPKDLFYNLLNFSCSQSLKTMDTLKNQSIDD